MSSDFNIDSVLDSLRYLSWYTHATPQEIKESLKAFTTKEVRHLTKYAELVQNPRVKYYTEQSIPGHWLYGSVQTLNTNPLGEDCWVQWDTGEKGLYAIKDLENIPMYEDLVYIDNPATGKKGIIRHKCIHAGCEAEYDVFRADIGLCPLHHTEQLLLDKQNSSPKEYPTATKADQQKLRYDLIPPEAMEAVAERFTLGAGKYEPRNWEKGMNWSRVFAAMMRHVWKWWGGEDIDPEDGGHHLAAVIWCAMVLMTYVKRGSGTDDRPTMSEM